MWVFQYLKCLVLDHVWVGSRTQYCLRCGKTETSFEDGRGLACNELGLVVEIPAVSPDDR